MPTEEQTLQNLMKCLRIDEKEAREVMQADKAIDRGEKLFELTDKQKRETRKYRQAERKHTVYNFNQRQRKEDEDKRFLIEFIRQTLDPESDSGITIINPEREMTFVYNGRKLKLTLSAPRS